MERERDKTHGNVSFCPGFGGKVHTQKKREKRYEYERNQVQKQGIPQARAYQKRNRSARDKAHTQVTVNDHLLQPPEILDVKRLIEPKLRPHRIRPFPHQILLGNNCAAFGAAHDLLDHHLVYNVAGSQRHKPKNGEAQKEKHHQHHEETPNDV